MISKIQKIWLWIFGGMFVVPEILWSPIGNFIYSFFSYPINGNPQLLRSNFLFNYQYENMLKIVVLLQSIGTVFFFMLWVKNKKNINSGLIFLVTLLLSLSILLITLFVAYLIFLFNPNFL